MNWPGPWEKGVFGVDKATLSFLGMFLFWVGAASAVSGALMVWFFIENKIPFVNTGAFVGIVGFASAVLGYYLGDIGRSGDKTHSA